MAQKDVLTWGALAFTEEPLPDATYQIEALADGTNFDNPEPILDVVKSLLTDGSLAVLQGWDNRDVVIHLRLSAANGNPAGRALAAAEAALMAEVLADSKSPLVWVPPADEGATCVFDVVAARLDRDTSDAWDVDEVRRGERFYLLTLTCLPFARPRVPVSVAALAPPPATETHFQVDDGTSLTGWSASSVGVGTVTRRNLIPNPRLLDTSNWNKRSNASLVPLTSVPGEAVLSSNDGAATYVYTPLMPITSGATYTGSIYVRLGSAASGTADVRLQWYDSAGTYLGGSESAPATVTSSLARISHTAAAPSNATQASMYVEWTPSASTSTLVVKQPLMEQASSVGAYFDGTTAKSGSTQYGWADTANASASVAYTVPSATVSGGAVHATGDLAVSGDVSLSLTRTGSVSMTSTPYLRVSAYAIAGTLRFRIGTGGSTAAIAPVAVTSSAILGYSDHYLAPSGNFDSLVIEAFGTSPNGAPGMAVSVAHIERTDKIVGAGSTTRQQSRSATVLGSAPTQAAIKLYDSTPAALGTDILVYTTRNSGRSPALRSLMTSSAAVTTDTAMVSGSRNTLTSAMVFRLPASSLTEGTYALLGRLNVTTAGNLTWQARMVSAAGATTVGSSRIITGTTALTVTTGYQVFTLGSLGLPVVAVEDDQMVELTLTGTADMTIDEAWLFGLDDGALTWIKDSDSLTWVEIRSPELNAARPSVYGGTGVLGDNSVCIDWKCESFGAHRFDPGQMQVFTVTTSSLVSLSTLEFYPRYHSHVEGDAA